MLPSYTATVMPGPELHRRTAWLNLRVWAPPPRPHTCQLYAGATRENGQKCCSHKASDSGKLMIH